VTRAPHALAVVDAGRATTSVSLLSRIDDRWRLLGTLSAAAGTPEPALLAVLAGRALRADPDLATRDELTPGALDVLPRLTATSRAPRTLVILAASRRAAGDLTSEAVRTGWRVEVASTDTHDPREMTELVLRRDVGAVLIGAGDPAGPDERAALDDLAALGGAAARRRPDLHVLLGGAIRGRQAWTEALGANPPGEPGRILEVPAARRGDGVRDALETLLADPADGRQRLRSATESLADLLDRRVELIDVGFEGGTRIIAEPGVAGGEPTSRAILTAQGALVPPEPGDETVDSVLAWTTGSLDRHRMGDRLRDLRGRPWVDAAGDGARLRLAAASAAMARMAALSSELTSQPTADVTVVCGGAFATAPPSAIALSIADTIRRPGVSQLVWDHARLLGPIGTIEDPVERRTLLADLVRDALVPLGSVVVTGGLGARRPGFIRDRVRPGRFELRGGGALARRDLVAGEIAFVDLVPGAEAEARFEFSEAVRFGRRTRHVTVPVTGGLAGLILDLRDVPLRLPERRDRRRTLLAEWSAQAWPGDER
jgi:hypothetical protein